jgi:hypothetical protein
MNTTKLNTKMSSATLAEEKDLQSPVGHPALASDSESHCTTPTTSLGSPGIKAPPLRYYQQFPPDQDSSDGPTRANTDATTEFDWRDAEPDHVKEEPTILDKVKDVLHIRRRS